MASDDDERTVFGQKLPPQPSRLQPQPPQAPVSGQPSQLPQGERTIFGMKVPQQPQHPAPPPPQQMPPQMQPPPQPGPPPQGWGQQPPYGQPMPQAGPPPGSEDTWLGGALSPRGGAPSQPQNWQQPQQQWQQPQPTPQPYPPQGWQGQPQQGYPQQPPQQPQGYPQNYYPQDPSQQAQFPQMQQTKREPVRTTPKIAFQDALRGSGLDIGTSSNPMIAAASDLLVLLGRLRTGLVEMQAIPLRDHVVREISAFVQKCQAAGMAPDDIEIARYALAATADDIVQTIPGNDPQYWQQFSMAAELLGDRSAGIGFFTRLEQVLAYPSQRKDVLELMLVCMALGFEGKFRTEPNGAVALTRMRAEVYQRLRAATARPTEELSHKWMPIVLGGRQRRGSVPLWVIGGVAAGMVVALFSTLFYILATEAQAVQNSILALHDDATEVSIESSGAGVDPVAYEAPSSGQLERIQGRLAQEIADGQVSVREQGDWISINVGSSLRFGVASAKLTENIDPLMQRIGETLSAEPGDILVEGHSDNQPLRRRTAEGHADNQELSAGRAQTVSEVLAKYLDDPSRITVEGVGAAKPLPGVDPDTPEGRNANRRVEILLKKEGRL